MIRQAISPRLAIRMRLNMPRLDPCPATAFFRLCGVAAGKSIAGATRGEKQSPATRSACDMRVLQSAAGKATYFELRRALGRPLAAPLYAIRTSGQGDRTEVSHGSRLGRYRP